MKVQQPWYKWIFLLGVLITFALNSSFAEAKRMGGGRSMGKQTYSAPQKKQAQQSAQNTSSQQTTPKRSWGGMLGGLAAGLGLGMLLSHFGGGAMMSGLANMLMIAAVVMLGIWLLRKLFAAKNRQAQPAYAGAQFKNYTEQFNEPPKAFSNVQTLNEQQPSTNVPAGFDTDAFLRQAKVYFVRLQAAWDAGNVQDIREFTTPEMFAEIRTDLAARDTNVINQTDVVTLEAELLGLEETADYYLASVQFSGLIRETAESAPESFTEVWNLSKPTAGDGGWVLAGIQQA